MAGLDKIIARIQAESEEAAARTLEAAKAEAEAILQNAREEAAAECAAIGRKADTGRGQYPGSGPFCGGAEKAAENPGRETGIDRQNYW